MKYERVQPVSTRVLPLVAKNLQTSPYKILTTPQIGSKKTVFVTIGWFNCQVVVYVKKQNNMFILGVVNLKSKKRKEIKPYSTLLILCGLSHL